MKKRYIKPHVNLLPVESFTLMAGSGPGNETGSASNNGTTYNGNEGTTRLAKGNNLFEDSEEEDDDPWNNNLW